MQALSSSLNGNRAGAMPVVDANHAIFAGVTLDPNNRGDAIIPDDKIDAATGVTEAGNVQWLATRADNSEVWTAR